MTNESQKDSGKTVTDQNVITITVTAKIAQMDKNTDVNFKVPPVELVFFSKPTYRVCISVELIIFVMPPPACLIGTGAGLSLVNDVHLLQQWRKEIHQLLAPKLGIATKQAISVVGVVPLFVQVEDLQVRLWLVVFKILAVALLLGTEFIQRCIRGMFPLERNLCPCHQGQLRYF